MKKALKRLLIVLLVLAVLFALFLAAWVFLIYPNFVAQGDPGEEPGIVEIAEKSERIDFNEENGVPYMNNEVVVFVSASASEEEAADLLGRYDADVDDSMADIRVYRLVFGEAMEYGELEDLIEELKDDPIVEDAYLNTVTELETDAAGEEEFEYRDPVYPNDPWNGDTWDVAVPNDENWGMEAIDAPGAWGYLDRLSTVRVGLIDGMPATSHEDLSFASSSCLFIDEDTGKTSTNKYSLSAQDHGTHVAGTMNAGWDNGAGGSGDGVSGVMGGKGELYYSAVYYDSEGTISTRYGTAYSYLLALKTLIDQDVQVINISQNTSRLIGFAASHGDQNAIGYLSRQADLAERGLSRIVEDRTSAGKPDFVICVAAGNSNSTYYYKDDKAPYGYREEMTFWEKIKYLFGWRGEIGQSLALYNNFLNLMDKEEVKDRVIVVGAVGIDPNASTPNHTRYTYAYFSNVGARVDVVAPGVDVYSCTASGYGRMSGTSMAAPHASGVAGLIFAGNPALSGPEVKDILVASTTGRYYHGGEFSGLIDANAAVVNALKTVKTPVKKVLKAEVDNGLDLCFVVDTTGSMGDDIDNAKENMAEILEHLATKTENYRVALIDYRDYPSRSGSSADYPYKVQLGFTSDNGLITSAIDGLDLGHGGDDRETVYSALMSAVGLDWREDAKKAVIILGDAAPLDPEPTTGLTYDEVLLALFNADIEIDYEDSDERVVDPLDSSLINVFSIGTSAGADASDFFEKISSSTGGSYVSVDDASMVGDAIIDSIEQIEVDEKVTVSADFGEEMAEREIDLYSNGEYLFTIETDENGRATIEDMEADTYRWASDGLCGGGLIDIEEDSRQAAVRAKRTYWFTPLLVVWERHAVPICAALLAYIAVCIALPVLIGRGVKRIRRRETGPVPAAANLAAPPEGGGADAPEGEGPLCPSCGSQSAPGARYCMRCGRALEEAPAEPAERVCPNCGHPCKEDETFCMMCGAKLDGGA